jgi:hypothetical protein
MANYVLLYSGGGMPEGEAERARGLQAWGEWFGALGDSLVDAGNPFSGQTRTIGMDRSVSEGGFDASGYSVIKAASIDEATEKAKGCPVLLGGSKITIYETSPM